MLDWRKKSVRKPLTVYVTGFISLAAGYCLLTGTDMPSNIMQLLQWLGGVTIGAYFISSTTEAIQETPRSIGADILMDTSNEPVNEPVKDIKKVSKEDSTKPKKDNVEGGV